MDHSQEKSAFLHREKGVWDRLTAEEQLRATVEWLHEELAAQLAVAHQEVAELALIHQELVDLRIKYAEARDDAREAGEKLLDLVESTRTDTAEIEWLRKERDDA